MRFRDANHDPTPAPQRPPPARSGEAGTMRRDEETADREVDLISSYFEKGMHPGLKMIFESLTAQHQQYRTCGASPRRADARLRLRACPL